MKTVTCNGCFDGIHPGHLFYLGFCRGQGDRLVVGINTDEYIKRNKRVPNFNAETRKSALMSLGFIDKVVLFEEDAPDELIRSVKPQIHCTGEEYGYDCAESITCKEIGAKLVLVPRTAFWATSSITEVAQEGVRGFMANCIAQKGGVA